LLPSQTKILSVINVEPQVSQLEAMSVRLLLMPMAIHLLELSQLDCLDLALPLNQVLSPPLIGLPPSPPRNPSNMEIMLVGLDKLAMETETGSDPSLCNDATI
jgi:hypothetical protein